MTTTVDQLSAALADRYRIEGELGQGGMATVYLAHDLRHDRTVALKVLSPDIARILGTERFLSEIRLVARLNHPHILPLFDSGRADGQTGGRAVELLYYVMPHVEGQSLRDKLNRETQLGIDEAVRIATEVASALDYAHRHGVVHRDIKPENIMFQDGHALVADFGIGKALAEVEGKAATATGMHVGTPAYMSPEQAAGESVDARSDIYSLGCVLYEMLVGEQPFTGPTLQAVIAKRFLQTPADITALRDSVTRPVARAVQRALARTPIDRFETAAHFMAALANAATAEPRAVAPERSLAVLAFENMSADRENEFFGDGIAEEIINALSRVEGLRVAARASAFSFKGKHEDLRVVGEKLNVATVLEGSVRKAGNRLRITVQLISAADGYQLWSERYDRELLDVFAVQDEIAAAIAERLQVTLTRPAAAPVRATPAEVEAYELTIRGRALVAQRGRSILAALECLLRAVELDPESAPAHAALGQTWRVYFQYGYGTATDAIPRAKAALARALEIDPDLGEACGILAIITLNYDADPPRAFELWERALRLDPSLHEIRALHATWGLQVFKGDDAAGLAELERVCAGDPLSSICATIHATGLAIAGRFDDAHREVLRARELDPTAFAPRYVEVWERAWARDPEVGLPAAEAAALMSGRHPFVLQSMTGLFMQAGDQVRAEAIHQELCARAVTTHTPEFSLAISALYLGRVEKAMDHAFASVDRHDALGPVWIRWPDTEALHAHPRYPELRRRMGM